MAKKTNEEPKEKKFPRAEILKSKAFSAIECDFLSAFLAPGDYTINEVKKHLEKIKKGAVK